MAPAIDFTDPKDRERYTQRYVLGEDDDVDYRLVAFIREVLGVDLTEAQEQIVASVEDNPKTAIVSGNGFGKSHTMACLGLAWMYTNEDAFGLITGGNNSQLKDGLWDDLASLQRDLSDMGFPGRVTNSNQDSQLKFEERPDHKMRCLSAQNAGSLEGKHQGNSLVVIEEANKPTIDRETIRSAISTVTDRDDRVVIIGNPPKRGHPFHNILRNDQYTQLHFSAFDSRNVRRELGETTKPHVDGIITPYRIKDIWQDSHPNRDWPGLEDARTLTASTTTELHEDWYRLVHGETPPSGSNVTRPFTEAQIESCDEQDPNHSMRSYDVIGVDLATSAGSDKTVVVGVTNRWAGVLSEIHSPSAEQNAEALNRASQQADTVIVDAIREENFLDTVDAPVTRFKGSMKPADDDTYENKRVQSYFEIGDWIDNGGAIDHREHPQLVAELQQVARVTEASVRDLRSREVYQITPKSEITSRINDSSPDRVDALAMACYGLQAHNQGRRVDPDIGVRELFN